MRRSGWTKWLIVIPAMLGIVLVTYVRYTTDIWGFGAFICQLIAILELAYGLRIAMLAQNRKKSYRLTPEERHEYARYLYEKQYHRYPAVANQMLLVMARMSVLLNNYERAAQELADIRIDKFNPAQLKLYYYLKVVTAAQMAEALKKAVPDKKEHPIRISIITLVLAYSTFFYGLWYGIKRDMGYEVRYRFAEISITVITISLAVLLKWH